MNPCEVSIGRVTSNVRGEFIKLTILAPEAGRLIEVELELAAFAEAITSKVVDGSYRMRDIAPRKAK